MRLAPKPWRGFVAQDGSGTCRRCLWHRETSQGGTGWHRHAQGPPMLLIPGGHWRWARLGRALSAQPGCRCGSQPLHLILAPLPTAPSAAQLPGCAHPSAPSMEQSPAAALRCVLPAVAAVWVSPGRCVRAPTASGWGQPDRVPPLSLSARPLPQRVRQETPTAAWLPGLPAHPWAPCTPTVPAVPRPRGAGHTPARACVELRVKPRTPSPCTPTRSTLHPTNPPRGACKHACEPPVCPCGRGTPTAASSSLTAWGTPRSPSPTAPRNPSGCTRRWLRARDGAGAAVPDAGWATCCRVSLARVGNTASAAAGSRVGANPGPRVGQQMVPPPPGCGAPAKAGAPMGAP